MSFHRNWLSLLILATIAIGCSSEPAVEEGTTEEAVAVDTAAIEEGIAAVNTQFEQAAVANDAVAVASLYSEDAIILPPNSTRSEGREAVQGVWSGYMTEGPITAMTLDTDKLFVAESGELATEIGTYTMSGTAADGTVWQDTGKYTTVLKNIDGTWLIVSDIWNSDSPLPGAAPAEGDVPAEGGV